MNTAEERSPGPSGSISLPESVIAQCGSQLKNDERVLTWFQPNLNEGLRFGTGFVILTNQAVLAKQPDKSLTNGTVFRWPLSEVREIKKLDRAGLGILELLGHEQLLQAFKFTASHGNAAGSLVAHFKQIQAGKANDEDQAPSICPSCGGNMGVGQSVCANCAPTAVPDTGKSLWRLTRFAKPRLSMILVGFLLTLLSAGAALIPFYLIGPLVDQILTPHQHAVTDNASAEVLTVTRNNFRQVPWYLGGMFFFAILS
ncbi:MAG: hypothetical protein ABL921_32365, partial [Pirellula sp.]